MGWYMVITDEMRTLGLTGNDLLVYAAIHGYSQNGEGCCFCSRAELAARCGVGVRTLDAILKRLVDDGYLDKEPITRAGRIYNSYAVRTPAKVAGDPCRNCTRPLQKLQGTPAEIAPNNKDYNKDYKTLSNESEARARKSGSSVKFVAPSVEDVRAYAAEQHLTLDADHFMAHYTANGWKVGKAPMKDWRAAVVAWVKREAEFQRPAARAAAAEDATLHPNAVWERLAREGKI